MEVGGKVAEEDVLLPHVVAHLVHDLVRLRRVSQEVGENLLPRLLNSPQASGTVFCKQVCRVLISRLQAAWLSTAVAQPVKKHD